MEDQRIICCLKIFFLISFLKELRTPLTPALSPGGAREVLHNQRAEQKLMDAMMTVQLGIEGVAEIFNELINVGVD